MSGQNSWSRVPYKKRQQIKQQLLARDGLRCCNCGRRIASVKAATIEHKKGRKQGGSLLDLANLGLAHAGCNYSGRYQRAGRVRVVDGVRFFDTEATEHPAPMFLPPPDAQKKRGVSRDDDQDE